MYLRRASVTGPSRGTALRSKGRENTTCVTLAVSILPDEFTAP